MRWVLWIVGALVALVVVVYVVGLLIPKSHVASASARYAATPEAIWTTLTDVAAFPQWRRDISRVELLPDENGHRGWREYGSQGTVSYRVVESISRQRLVSRIADQNLPYGGSWTYELTPSDSGTRLTITERGDIYNPIFRFVARFVLGYTATMNGMLRAIGTKHGEAITPEPARAA
jgi:Polyketide cyclase / dehydrase and lipid transport